MDISGEWFSGENFKFVGLFQDRTSNIKTFYKLKSTITSRMFEDINCDFKYSRDLQEFKIKANTDYSNKSYSLLVESSELTLLESLYYAEVKWVDQFYSIKANSTLKGNGKVQVEIHFDRYRDLYLEVWGTAKRFSNKFGVQLKWDVNR